MVATVATRTDLSASARTAMARIVADPAARRRSNVDTVSAVADTTRGAVLPYALDGLPDGLDVVVWDGSGPLPAAAKNARLYVVPYQFSHRVLEPIRELAELEVVLTQTAGYEHLEPYLRPGVTVCNARGVHSASTAELAALLTLASLRGLPGFVRSQDRGEWAYDMLDSLADKQVLIVGYGSIGEALEARLLPFECDVVRVARSARDNVYGFDSLPDLLPMADVVVLLVPLTQQTQRLVDASFLARMKDGALLVNVARGGVVDTDALLAELSSGRLRAALDVTDPEPLPADHPLWRAPGVLITPHVGGNSTAFLPRTQALVREQLERWVDGRPLLNVVVPG